ncbi:MAG: hypothetical protein CL908_27160 [Deltaproteobacteria bacterium]|jgi:catechol 2,3-dioxygenase-like lactoylglutathione lyase family enzyme|nr:hypothetical protein [Deltaproteobacteria bacterium]
MITKGTHHISLMTGDLEAAREFYGSFLGLAEIERPDFGFPGAWYQAGSVQLHLIGAPPGVELEPPSSEVSLLSQHLAFEIEDY